ncbi:phytoene/squalene synthase family protein [Pleomorphomonas sp. JP5]|uniref:phytoene/squalene synthase family protein n=1 Tax=Pleomorphomonas sp. JP5 TaxID=2942998 RepID=UPI002043D49B|nr:phytoene/squalene synthase family protein [Pleomorphomonas sp. JP5]MCM5556174.1 squalene/phytoene synthase family protein [Pleomorphomonas sp. JP5]
MVGSARLDDAYGYCEGLVRDHDRDRWLADGLLPDDKRRHAFAIHAFSYEAARIRESIHEAMPGEIRLQWWVDAIEGEARGDVAGHPVAAALIDTIHRFSLRRSGFVNLLEARRFDLYDDAMPTLNDLEGYAGETSSVLFLEVAQVLCDGADPKGADAAGHAGVAYAMTGLMRALPIHARRNQVYVPADLLKAAGIEPDDVRHGRKADELVGVVANLRDSATGHLEKALSAFAEIDPRARPAFLPLAFVRPYLATLAKTPVYGPVAEIAAWRKPLILWWFGRRL